MNFSSTAASPAEGRRSFRTLAAGPLAAPGNAPGVAATAARSVNRAAAGSEAVVLYASVGAELGLYHVDEASFTVERRAVVTVPASIQYVWPHPARRLLYVAYSNRARGLPGDVHGVAVLGVDAQTGRMQAIGNPLRLDNRPIHITVNRAGTHLLVACNEPSALDLFALGSDGLPGARLDQAQAVDAGIYAHQVRVTPSGHGVVLVTRGNDATGTRAEDPGAFKLFALRDGQLVHEHSVAPGGGFGFGPRHVDFHPTRPWMFAAMERENQLQVFGLRDGKPDTAPLFTTTTLREPANVRPGQVVGPIHVSRDGRFVYLANRADGTVDVDGNKVFVGGENSIAVFRIDAHSGAPTLIQTIDTQAVHARTFSLHPNGRMLVAASVAPMLVREPAGKTGEAATIRRVAAALSLFSVAHDGTLAFVRQHDVDTTGGPLFWCSLFSPGDGWSANVA